jgi:pimeloyl-ACP methyl ester carboxylesterase
MSAFGSSTWKSGDHRRKQISVWEVDSSYHIVIAVRMPVSNGGPSDWEHRRYEVKEGGRSTMSPSSPPVERAELVLTHSFRKSGTCSTRRPTFADRDYLVFAPDRRGFGDSSQPVGGYDKVTMAESSAPAPAAPAASCQRRLFSVKTSAQWLQ